MMTILFSHSSHKTTIIHSGGPVYPYQYLSTVDIFDVVTGIWTSTSTGAGSISAARSRLVGVRLGDDRVMFAGGMMCVVFYCLYKLMI